MECVDSNDQIRHPLVRECLAYAGMGGPEVSGLEIFHQSDLPGRSGTGSSSSFAVALLHALYAFQGVYSSPERLARDAIEVERNRLKEAGGWQDQHWAARGGFGLIRFRADGVSHELVPMAKSQLNELSSHLLLSFTGIHRCSHEIAKGYGPLEEKKMYPMMKLVEDCLSCVVKRDYEKLGYFLDQCWRIKASLPGVCSQKISHLYSTARAHGAWGGKVTGAGGGGCLLLAVSPGEREKVERALRAEGCVNVPFSFTRSGSRVLYFGDDDF